MSDETCSKCERTKGVIQLLASLLNLDEIDLAILDEITFSTIAETRAMSFEVGLSARAMQYRLNKLADMGLVQRVGQRRGWKLKANKEKFAEYKRDYRGLNSEKMRVHRSRRRARKLSFPDTLTEQEWLFCLEYFNHACAACGDFFENVKSNMDHWVALSDENCPGTVAENMIPLCEHCNKSKNASDALEWLIQKFGEEEALLIFERILAYFEGLS